MRAATKDIDRIVAGYNDHLLNQMDMPLSELIPQIKEAAEERTAITGGRIGAHPSLPLLVTDANKLQDYYGAMGAVECAQRRRITALGMAASLLGGSVEVIGFESKAF